MRTAQRFPGLCLIVSCLSLGGVVKSLSTAVAAIAPAAIVLAQSYPADSPAAEALARAVAAADRIAGIPDGQRTFENTVGAIDDLLAQLELDTNMMMFMAYVSTDAAQREKGLRAEEDVTNWLIAFGKREDIAAAVRAYAATRPALEGEQERLLDFLLRDFRRAGMDLPADQREKLAGIEREITRLGIEFEKNIRDDETTVPLTREELAGMPEEFINALPRAGDLYLADMSYPTFIPMMDYAENETTRARMWVAYKRRGGQKNVEVLERILRLRAEAASILGYSHPADYEIEVRMAKNAATVKKFYDDLRPLVRAKAIKDWEEFQNAKREHTGDAKAVLQPWDQSFYEKRLIRSKYAVDSELVRQYFPLDRVMDGLFSITQSLYGLTYRDVTADADSLGWPVWHPDVRLYEVSDKADNRVLGWFFIDLHPRANKYSHAAQWGLAQHKVWSDGRVTKPLAALVCNFTKPTSDKPSLMTHDEVETFFHEFGHCLHTILSEATIWRFSGTGVERDFVEAPSQMFENWVWDPHVLGAFARHYRTDEPLPRELLDNMIAARNLGSGMKAERQIYYGLTDQIFHTAPGGEIDTIRIAVDLFGQAELYKPIENIWHHASFTHLIGYRAGYYGYLWSLVYAEDMFQRFKELGMLDPQAGQYYRKHILSRGGTRDGLDLVKTYLGREPSMEPFLRHLGLGE